MKILIIVAHPDDEVLGCGGTIAKHDDMNDNIHMLYLADGTSSREINIDAHRKRLAMMRAAATVLGIENIWDCDYLDNRMDDANLLAIIKDIENVIDKYKPDIIYTHYEHDLNIDHQITSRAVRTACRPFASNVKELYEMEIPSNTEQGFIPFEPNVFVDLSCYLEVKLEAMRCYSEELRDYPFPRSERGIEVFAEMRGMQSGFPYAEGFKLIRGLK